MYNLYIYHSIVIPSFKFYFSCWDTVAIWLSHFLWHSPEYIWFCINHSMVDPSLGTEDRWSTTVDLALVTGPATSYLVSSYTQYSTQALYCKLVQSIVRCYTDILHNKMNFTNITNHISWSTKYEENTFGARSFNSNGHTTHALFKQCNSQATLAWTFQSKNLKLGTSCISSVPHSHRTIEQMSLTNPSTGIMLLPKELH